MAINYESTKRAIKKWNENNKERMLYLKYRGTAKTYIRRATLEDLKDLKQMIEEKIAEKEKEGA